MQATELPTQPNGIPGRLIADFTVKIKPVPYSYGEHRNGQEKAKGIPNYALIHYKAALTNSAIDAIKNRNHEPKFLGPVAIELTFFKMTTRGNSADDWDQAKPVFDERMGQGQWVCRQSDQRADLTNLQKSAEDALSGVLFSDDTQTVDISSRRVYGPFEGVRVVVKEASLYSSE